MCEHAAVAALRISRRTGEATAMSQELINHTAIPSRFGELTLLWREDEQGAKVVEILLPRKRTSSAFWMDS